MKPEALSGLIDMTLKREGYTTYFYADVVGLISIGKGFLADPIVPAPLEFTCGPDVVRSSWQAVKAAWRAEEAKAARGELTTRATDGGVHYQHVPGNVARATDASIERTFSAHVGADEATLRAIFPRWDDWPWQAQTVTASIAYAGGARVDIEWPRYTAACRAQQWAIAAIECKPSPAKLAAQTKSYRDRVAEQVRLLTEIAEAGTVYVEPAEPPMVKTKNEPPIT